MLELMARITIHINDEVSEGVLKRSDTGDYLQISFPIDSRGNTISISLDDLMYFLAKDGYIDEDPNIPT